MLSIFPYVKANSSSESWYSDREMLDAKSIMEEFMFLGLRMTRGIKEKEFHKVSGHKIMAIYGTVIEKYVMNGLLERRNGRIYLTKRGLDLANQVMADFLL